MNTRTLASVAAFAAFSTISNAGILNQFNLIVTGNLNSQSEVEGRTLIGGSLSGSASNYGVMLNPAQSLGTDVLVVGGNITAQNVNINAGNLRLGGTNGAQNLNFNGGGQLIADPSISGIGATVGAELASNSQALAQLAATNTVNFPSPQPGPLNFQCIPDSNGLAVFNVPGSLVFSNNNVQQIDINFNGATNVIINVTGTNINFTQGNFVGNFTSMFARSRVLWNFHQATNIDIGGKAFNGALLAPAASYTSQGVNEGSVYVASFTQRGEVHLPGYIGIVPAPGVAAFPIAALLMARRRR